MTDSAESGATKSNIGHLEGSSGIAGVIKALLVLERGIIPPIGDLDQLNPRIDDVFLKLQVSNKNLLHLHFSGTTKNLHSSQRRPSHGLMAVSGAHL